MQSKEVQPQARGSKVLLGEQGLHSICVVAFSVERDGNKTGGDRMFLGLSASSNPGVSVVTWGVEKDEPGHKNIDRNICLHS